MPIYEYKCTKCGKKLEVLQSHHNSLKTCSEATDCKEDAPIEKMISSFSINSESSESHCESGGCGMSDFGGCQGFCGM